MISAKNDIQSHMILHKNFYDNGSKYNDEMVNLKTFSASLDVDLVAVNILIRVLYS